MLVSSLVRSMSPMPGLPEISHGIASRPSRLIARIDSILAWFERHDGAGE